MRQAVVAALVAAVVAAAAALLPDALATDLLDLGLAAALYAGEWVVPGRVEAPLRSFCERVLAVTRAQHDLAGPAAAAAGGGIAVAGNPFVVDRRFDLSLEFHALGGLGAGAQWEDMCEMKRRRLATADHGAISSKVEWYRFLNSSTLPFSRLLWAAHANEPDASAAGAAAACAAARAAHAAGVGVVVKPAHCVKGQGLAYFPPLPPGAPPLSCDALAAAVSRCMQTEPDAAAWHMRGVARGAVVQAAFAADERGWARPWWRRATGVPRPAELKLLVVWGRVLVINAEHIPGVKHLFPDGSASGTNPALSAWLHAVYVPSLLRAAEALASAIGSPMVRLDFLVALPSRRAAGAKDGRWALNEVELVTGIGYHDVYAQPCMARLWRAGYERGAYVVVDRSDAELREALRGAAAALERARA